MVVCLNWFLYERINKELINNQLRIENNLRPKEFENSLKLALYQEVKLAIEKKDTAVSHITLIAVNEMLKDKEDSIFRGNLISILLSLPNSKTLMETQNNIDNFELPLSKTKNMTIDVFYLEDILSESKPRAKIIDSLLQKKFPKYSIRVRLLPKAINARIGYRIGQNEIRFEADERNVATELQELIKQEKIFTLEQPVLREIKGNTPNYVSIFVRNM